MIVEEPTFKIARDLWLIDLVFNTREVSREEARELAREMRDRSTRLLEQIRGATPAEATLLAKKADAANALAEMYDYVARG